MTQAPERRRTAPAGVVGQTHNRSTAAKLLASCLIFFLLLGFLTLFDATRSGWQYVIRKTNFTTTSPDPVPQTFRSSSKLNLWIESEEILATQELLANIGPAAGAGDGLVIASPSQAEADNLPDYYYTWTRDSALVISSLLPSFLPEAYLRPWSHPLGSSADLLVDKRTNQSALLLEPLLRAYISSQADLQTVQTRSGDLYTGGLNEPKFMVDGTAFDGDWGRPQRDGPALRALTMIPYANYVLDRGFPADIKYVHELLYDPARVREPGSVIKTDLEEVASGWRNEGFDLWEEVNGHHLFNHLVSLRALEAGARLAKRLDDFGAADYYAQQAADLQSSLSPFWAPEGYFRATTFEDTGNGRTGLDCAFCLSVIHAYDRRGTHSGSGGMGPDDPTVLSTLREYVRSFDGMYRINRGREWTDGWAVGRYKEDTYDGVATSQGNPWFICTFSVAHVLYLVQFAFLEAGEIHLDSLNLTVPFWTDLLGHAPNPIESWTRNGRGGSFERAIRRLGEVADAYVQLGKRYAMKGKMNEQIHRASGEMIGARDLTWSYASFIEVARARRAVQRQLGVGV